MSDNEQPDNVQPTFEERIEKLIVEVERDENGKLKFAEGSTEAEIYAARAEIRRRDTQASYNKTATELKAAKAEARKLAEAWEQDASNVFTQEEQTELAELKVQDPDAWFTRLTELKQQRAQGLESRREEISRQAQEESELEIRQRQLEEFNEANPGITIDDDFIANDLPPRVTSKLENGDISFLEFLEEAKKYATTERVIQQPPSPGNSPNIGDASGGAQPPADDGDDDVTQYANTTF